MNHDQPCEMNPGRAGFLGIVITGMLCLLCIGSQNAKAQGIQQPTLSCTLEEQVIIPPLESPILAPRCSVPEELVFVDSLDSYSPNPFTVRLTCVNNGNTPAYNVTGSIELPPNVEFDPPGQRTTMNIYPAPLNKWQIGDPIPELTWKVRWIPRLREEAAPVFRLSVTGKNFSGALLDSTEVRDSVRIPGLQPLFSGRIYIPDSLALRSDSSDVEPNPFPVRLILKNISPQVGMIRRIVLYFPTSAGLSLNPASQYPADFDPVLTLDKGEEETYEWFIDVTKRSTRRWVQIRVDAFDDGGNPMAHFDILPIASVPSEVIEVEYEIVASCRTTVEKLIFDKPRKRYIPDTFVITAGLRNTGSRDLHAPSVQLLWHQLPGLDMIEVDPSFPDTTNPKTQDVLHPGDSVNFSWGFRLKNWNKTWYSQFVTYTLEIAAQELPAAVRGNPCLVQVTPSKILTATEPLAAEECTLHPSAPNPFATSTVVRFSLRRAMPVTILVADALGRTVRCLADGEFYSVGSHNMRFDANGLPDGLYFCTLIAGEQRETATLLLLR